MRSVLNPVTGFFRKQSIVELNLSGEIPEQKEKKLIPFLPGSEKLTYWEVEYLLSSLERDNSASGIYIRISGLKIGPARASSIRKRILELKKSGKKVAVYLESGGNMDYLIASAADVITVPPWTTLNLIGLKAEATFYRDMLDKLGIVASFIGIGEYKSASEMFTKSSMSEAHREMIESLVSDLQSQLNSSVAAGRGMTPERVRRIMDNGPYTARQALDEGLIDMVGYGKNDFDEIFETSGSRRVKAGRYLKLLRMKNRMASVVDTVMRRNNVIAVVSESGFIMSGQNRGGMSIKTIGSDSTLRALEKLSSDRRVRAVVLRILTPGGSGAASDVIRNKLMEISEIKTVVVSMSDVAASGGYMIALGADYVVADPMTLTGSIGIVSGKFDLGGLYAKLGINRGSGKGASRSMMFSSSTNLTPDEEKRLRELLRHYYTEFVNLVSLSRDIDAESAEQCSKGRVWTGRQAHSRNLVDELGGLSDAVTLAASKNGIEGPGAYTVKFISPGNRPRASSLLRTSSDSGFLTESLSLCESFRKETVFALMPYFIKIL